ncbi:MAG: alkaline phosphatase PhoX [Sporichthyaceae bacterium]
MTRRSWGALPAGPSRRSLLQAAAAAGMGLVLPGPWHGSARAATATSVGTSVGYGALTADPGGRLALPPGFTYSLLSESGLTRLDSGEFSPTHADGSCSFAAEQGRVALVVNHEISPAGAKAAVHTVPHVPGFVYDPGCPAGTTTILLNRDGTREREYVSLAGTDYNCAGGPSPWGTWLSCEESEGRAGEGGRTKDHGYVFEVDPLDAEANRDPQPIKAFGRFKHEACAIDPARNHVYLTEDAEWPSGHLYRWSPPAGRQLGRGVLRELAPAEGRLEAMVVRGFLGLPVDDLSRVSVVGSTFGIGWAEVPDRDAATTSVRKQFAHYTVRKGEVVSGPGPVATRAHKLEGCWYGNGGIFIVSSFADPVADGSPAAHGGQVWFLDPTALTFTLVLRLPPRDPNAPDAYDGPDNIALCPYGGLVVAEDGKGPQHLFGITPAGQTYPIARNERIFRTGYSEMSGVNFSPDRTTLFANVYETGTVYAIKGPWHTQF